MSRACWRCAGDRSPTRCGARVAEDELRAALRARGFASLSEVEAVVLETDGSLSVLARAEGPAPALEGVVGAEEASVDGAPSTG